jgi:drug/metabolite transporter (DMT)-like permease
LKPKHWLTFIILGIVWSASFLWIKIALQEVGPITLVAYRVVLGLAFCALVMLVMRVAWPRTLAEWVPFLVVGLTNVAIPFFLITWGEQSIDSAVASILNATTPLFTIILATVFLRDDKLNAQRLIGLLIGFGGVVVLMSKDLSTQAHNSVLGQVAVVVASLSYAISAVYVRKATQNVHGLLRGAVPLVSATLVMWLAALLVESPIQIPALPLTWIALLWLGVLGSGLAFVLVFYLIHEIGPTRATMVTYIFPPGGVILGVIFLGEELSWQLALGTLLIIGSLVVVNWKPRKIATEITESTE